MPTPNIARSAAKPVRTFSVLCVLAVLAACVIGAASQGEPSLENNQSDPSAPVILAAATMAGPLVADATPAPTPDTTRDSVLIWWPASIYPDSGSAAERTLLGQLDALHQAEDVTVSIRLKKAEGAGSIADTMRTASQVAPSVMPDITLLRYSQIVTSAGLRLVQPIDAKTLNFEDSFRSTGPLTRVQGTVYGVPYLLELQHAAYRSAAIPTAPSTLSDLLKSDQQFLFPARGTHGVSATLLAQYIAAGGRLAETDGSDTLDRAALLTVLSYYEQAVKANTSGPTLLGYSMPAQYWAQFMAGRANIIQIDSTMYLAQEAGGMPITGPSAVAVAPLPAPSDVSVTMVDGWMWVITATEPNRKARAAQVVNWLMDPERLGSFSHALGMLPARRSALDTWKDATNSTYMAFVVSELGKDAAPLPDMVRANVAGALQGAFEDVLNGRKTADAAADEAIAKLKAR